ncbi:MAG TPA: hypothetical protein PK328_04985 [Chitinophagaceae bacterium]|nr:hypothetical protein [Chitinophagaceae bacterium]
MNNIYKLFEKRIIFWSAIASIIALVFVFITDKWSIIISLSLFWLIVVILFLRILWVINRYIIAKNPDEILRTSTFITYRTNDGVNIEFETYRHIQSKRLILYEFDHGFKWSGSKLPTFESKLQDVASVTQSAPGQWDKAVLLFKKPLLYNESAMVHFLAKMNDADGKSLPYVEVKVVQSIDVIWFRIVLRHKIMPYNKTATLKRKSANSVTNAEYEILEAVPFDQVSMSYEYPLITPTPGYYYRIDFEK